MEYLNSINKYAALFVYEVEGFNAVNQYDINIHSENFLIPVLNEIFGLSLENLNASQKKNYPAIDLADFKNRVAFQITATSSNEKIKKTLETFNKYKLQNEFDTLYIYIITHKKDNYNEEKTKEIIPGNFTFSAKEHILDKDDLLKRINQISSTSKIEYIARLYQHEFSEIQIERRKYEYQSGYLNKEPENIFPNLLKIIVPKSFYKAELNIDEADITEKLNLHLETKGIKRLKHIQKGKLIKYVLECHNCENNDWILHENWVYSFRDLSKNDEILSKIVDLGTVTEIDCSYFCYSNQVKANVFKYLLRKTFTEFCKTKQLEWYNDSGIFRFANNRENPSYKQIRWKGKNEATKTVIYEIINKKEKHLICYRSLAFKCSFTNIDDDWYIIINPTWSFTNPGGYVQSRFESSYMSGLKKLENNKSIFNYYRFWGYYLTYSDLFTQNYPYISVGLIKPLSISPSIEENKWNPPKEIENVNDKSNEELVPDNELFDESFFD
jgi:hypothetical protein